MSRGDGVACTILLCRSAAVLGIRPVWINFLGNKIEIVGGGEEARWKQRKLISRWGQREGFRYAEARLHVLIVGGSTIARA